MLKGYRRFFYRDFTGFADPVYSCGDNGSAVFDGSHSARFAYGGDALLVAFPDGFALGCGFDGQTYLLSAVERGGAPV